MTTFNGLGMHLGNLSRLSTAQSRSISAENPTGAKSGGGRAEIPTDENGLPTGPSAKLGKGWKVKPCIAIEPGCTAEIANIEGSGAIQQMWMTVGGYTRWTILRIYWDDQELPSVECPIGDFFASAYVNDAYGFGQISSLPVCVNPGSGFNCYWEMPFRKRCRITVENLNPNKIDFFYQINYALTDIPQDAAYFHAQFRRVNPVPYGKVHTVLDGIRGKGQFVGCYMAWQMNNDLWWGEGEIKFYMDGDTDPALSDGKEVAGSTGFPTICGTGTEDYFGGSYNFENKRTKQYQEFTTPHVGVPHIVRPDGVYQANLRFSMYRWHIVDPIRFNQDLKVTVQALGWRRNYSGFLQRQDDIASVAYWYQTLPTVPFPEFPCKDFLEIV